MLLECNKQVTVTVAVEIPPTTSTLCNHNNPLAYYDSICFSNVCEFKSSDGKAWWVFMAQLISDRRACVSRRVFDRRIVFPSYVWAVWSTAGISIPIHTFICFSCRTLGTTMTGRLSRLGLQVQVSFFCLVVKSLLVSLSISGANVVGVYLGIYQYYVV
jgi:hypothetical protein